MNVRIARRHGEGELPINAAIPLIVRNFFTVYKWEETIVTSKTDDIS
jgi:hypothetical protein